MAVKLDVLYPGQVNAPSAAYPQGSFKNETSPGAADGTPLEQRWANDWLGFLSALLSEAGLTANGLVDQVGASQYLNALKSVAAASTPDASETVKGKVELATVAETIAGTSTALSVHPAGAKALLSAQALGVGQSWQNMTASRAFDTTYTNSTGRPISISVTPQAQPNRSYELIVGGVTLGSLSYGSATVKAQLSAVVPPGATYRVNQFNGGLLETWAELRA